MKFTILILSTLFLLLSAGIGDLYAQTDAEPVCVAIPADVNGEVDVKPVSVAIPADVTGELDVKPVSIKLQLQSTSSDPTLTPTVAAPAYPTKSNSFTLTGTKKANSYLYVSNQLTAASFSATTWSASVYLPVEGSNTFGVFAVDGSGNQSQTVSVTVVRDTIPPAVTISAPSSGALTRNRQITVSGTVNEPVVSVTVNGVVATMNGQEWSAACQLEEGINTITAQATDLAGNRGAASITVTLDSTPPQLKVSTLSDGAFTNNGTLNIAGTVQDEKGLQALRINGVIVPVNADSGFSFALAQML